MSFLNTVNAMATLTSLPPPNPKSFREWGKPEREEGGPDICKLKGFH